LSSESLPWGSRLHPTHCLRQGSDGEVGWRWGSNISRIEVYPLYLAEYTILLYCIGYIPTEVFFSKGKSKMTMKKMHDQKLKQPFVHVENFSVCLKLSSELFHSFVSNNVDIPV
jgi:hypothetical protein